MKTLFLTLAIALLAVAVPGQTTNITASVKTVTVNTNLLLTSPGREAFFTNNVPGVINAAWYGLSTTTSAASNTAAFNAAANAASNYQSTLFIPHGTYAVNTGLWACVNLQGNKAIFTYAGSAADNGTILTVGTSNRNADNTVAFVYGLRMDLPEIVVTGTSETPGTPTATNLVGVNIAGLNSADIYIPRVEYAGTGVQGAGSADTNAWMYSYYCNIRLGFIQGYGNCVRLLNGFNGNTFYGGRLEVNQATVGGVIPHWTNSTSLEIVMCNGNTFIGTSFEGGGQDWMIKSTNSGWHTFMNCRYEPASGYEARARVQFGSSEYSSSQGNWFIGGYGLPDLIVSQPGVDTSLAPVNIMTHSRGLELVGGGSDSGAPILGLLNNWGPSAAVMNVYDSEYVTPTNNRVGTATNWAFNLNSRTMSLRYKDDLYQWLYAYGDGRQLLLGPGSTLGTAGLGLGHSGITARKTGDTYDWFTLDSASHQLRVGDGSDVQHHYLVQTSWEDPTGFYDDTNAVRLGSNLRTFDTLLLRNIGITGDGTTVYAPSSNQAMRACITSTNEWEIVLQNFGANTNARANSQFRVADWDSYGSGVFGYFSSNTIWGSAFADKVVLYADGDTTKGLRLHSFSNHPIELASGTVGRIFSVEDNAAYFWSASGQVLTMRSNKVFLPQLATNTLMLLGAETNLTSLAWSTNHFTNDSGALKLLTSGTNQLLYFDTNSQLKTVTIDTNFLTFTNGILSIATNKFLLAP